jgi:hypothetical protein
MIRARNSHSASIDGVAPSTEGEFDENNAAVKIYLACGLLLAVAPVAPADGAASDATDPTGRKKGK